MPDKPVRFLLADDGSADLGILPTLMHREGLEFHRAGTLDEALGMLRRQDHHLVFVDAQADGSMARDLAAAMRGDEAICAVPLIVVNADHRWSDGLPAGRAASGIDYIPGPVDPVMLQSRAEVFFRLARQSKDLELQRRELHRAAGDRDVALASLRAHADNSPLALIECDDRLIVRSWSLGAARIFGPSAVEMIGQPLAAAGRFAPETLAMWAAWLGGADLLARHSAEISATGVAGEIHCEIYGSVLVAPAGGSASLSLQILDVTERHRAEAVHTALVRELNHRIRNTLANVQAIARQTLRSARDLPDFETRFNGRLQALARAHAVLSDITWTGASLNDLVEEQVKAGVLDRESLPLGGLPVSLTPENMLRLALVLHELGTNAARHGARSRPGGRVDLDWHVEDAELVITWRESGGPQVMAPARRGFGSALIASGVGDSRVSVEWLIEGVIWTIRVGSGFQIRA